VGKHHSGFIAGLNVSRYNDFCGTESGRGTQPQRHGTLNKNENQRPLRPSVGPEKASQGRDKDALKIK
jgi:hypothetical protein